MKQKLIYGLIVMIGACTVLLFQNCSPMKFKDAEIPSQQDLADPASVPNVTTTTVTNPPPVIAPPEIINILPANSRWKLVDMVLGGVRQAIPTINRILLSVVLQNENLRVAAEAQTGSTIKALYFIEFDQFCHPITGNYLGISSATSNELLGNPLDLQGGQFSTYTDNEDLNGPLCSSDSEATVRSEASKQVNAMTKHTSGNLHFERRGQDLVVTIGTDVFVFSPL